MSVEKLGPRQRVSRSLKEQQRCLDISELVDPKSLWLAGGVKRVGVEDQTICLLSLGDEVGTDSPTHRPAGQKQPLDIRSQVVGGGLMAINKFLRTIGRSRTALGVWVVESENGVPGFGKTIAKYHHEGVVLVGPCAMSEKDPIGAVPDHTARHFTSTPRDHQVSNHLANVGHRVSVLDMKVVVHNSADDVASAAARHIADLLTNRGNDRFTLGLAGGSTPAATYRALRDETIRWATVDAWLSDERWEAPSHERSNGNMAATALLDHVNAEFHRPLWSKHLGVSEAAMRYDTVVRSLHSTGRPDLVLLGIGDDGHTASLFPGTAALEEDKRWIVANHVPQQDEVRITATYPLLWAAHTLMFLVVGAGKAEALRDSLDGITPAGRTGLGEAEVIWHVDRAAAAHLS